VRALCSSLVCRSNKFNIRLFMLAAGIKPWTVRVV